MNQKSPSRPLVQMSTVRLRGNKKLLLCSSSQGDSYDDVILDESQGQDMGSTGNLKFKTISDYDSINNHNRNKTTIVNNAIAGKNSTYIARRIANMSKTGQAVQGTHGGPIYIGSGMGSEPLPQQSFAKSPPPIPGPFAFEASERKGDRSKPKIMSRCSIANFQNYQ